MICHFQENVYLEHEWRWAMMKQQSRTPTTRTIGPGKFKLLWLFINEATCAVTFLICVGGRSHSCGCNGAMRRDATHKKQRFRLQGRAGQAKMSEIWLLCSATGIIAGVLLSRQVASLARTTQLQGRSIVFCKSNAVA